MKVPDDKIVEIVTNAQNLRDVYAVHIDCPCCGQRLEITLPRYEAINGA